MRPNIRVEIKNNLVEAMEVDENEEGEISDHDEMEMVEKRMEIQPKESNKSAMSNFSGGIFDKKEEEKLQERARRFCLNPEEIKNFKDDDMQILHSSLGINESNEPNVRFEVIHVRGIDQMTAGDILDYFLEYAPNSIEWLDKESCNVVWLDRISSSRALHFMSKAVRGMPVRDDSSYFDNLQETEEVDQSILLINKNREVQLAEDPEETPTNKLLNGENSVDISEITTTIPPGYWRLGDKHPKVACLLLRFALKTDKQSLKTEQFGRYYKNQGKKKPAQSRKVATQGIFGRNKDMHNKVNEENPWSLLAKTWDEDAPFREPERSAEPEQPKVEVKSSNLKHRLGLKRKEEDDDDEPEKVQEVAPKKKVKIPRMRMYADEEEEKIKRRQMLQRINHQMEKIDQNTSANSDLRTILNMSNRTHGVKLEKAEPEVFDLGSRLKNRNKKMVFQIETETRRAAEERHPAKSSRERHRDRIRRKYSHSDDEDTYRRSDYRHDKPKSKVAVVIKTQRRPTVASAVASTVWSRVAEKAIDSESESQSASSESEASDSGSEEVEEVVPKRRFSRPGFSGRSPDHSITQSAYKNPLKIEINNDHCRRT